MKHLAINVSVLPSNAPISPTLEHLSVSPCCPLMPAFPRTDPVLILISFVSIYMTETGTVVHCLLRNVVVLLNIECNTVIYIKQLE